MGKKLYRQETSGEIHALNPQSHYVTLPTSTIDLWMPLIGAVGVGVYALYRRLAREGRVRGSDLKRLAKAARISDNTLRSLNRTLERIGFIAVERPEGANRVRHYTTEIHLLEPPTSVPAELIRELECQSGYEIVAHWLVESADADLTAHTPPAVDHTQTVETTLPQPRPQGNTNLCGLPQTPSQRTIPPLPQPRPQGMGGANPSGLPQASPQRTIPPLPQPRPQETDNASLGGAPANASPRLSMPSSGPVALSSIIESVYRRQIALMSAPHSAIQREPALNSAPGSVNQRVIKAPTSATLESSYIESLREWEESPLPLISENLQAPISPHLPWNDSQIPEKSSQPTTPTRSSPSPQGAG